MKEEDEIVTVGTACRNGGCGAVSALADNMCFLGISIPQMYCFQAYTNGPSDDLTCVHHPGTAIFHEG